MVSQQTGANDPHTVLGQRIGGKLSGFRALSIEVDTQGFHLLTAGLILLAMLLSGPSWHVMLSKHRLCNVRTSPSLSMELLLNCLCFLASVFLQNNPEC